MNGKFKIKIQIATLFKISGLYLIYVQAGQIGQIICQKQAHLLSAQMANVYSTWDVYFCSQYESQNTSHDPNHQRQQ